MTNNAPMICKNAHVTFGQADSGRLPSADDLLILLAVGRTGRSNAAADILGLNHPSVMESCTSLAYVYRLAKQRTNCL